MRDELLDLRHVTHVDVVDFFEIAVNDRAARHQHARPVVGLVGKVAIGKHGLAREAAADCAPVLVEGGDRLEVGNVDLVDDRDGLIDDAADHVQALDIERSDRADIVDVDRARNAADQPVRVRVLAAEDRLDLHQLTLKIERFEVVRHRHQVGFGRQLVRRVAPVGVAERPELSRFNELLQP